MNDFALIAIGMMFGMVLLLVGLAAGFLFYTAIQMRKEASESKKSMASALKSNSTAIDLLRSEVALSLSRMDAERQYEASLVVQKASKRIAQTASVLSRIVFASSSPAGSDIPSTPGFTMEEEAADDARMIEERNRWLAQQEPDTVDPKQVTDFFAERRRKQHGGIHTIGSTPPLAEGAYQTAVQDQPEKPVTSLPDLGDDDDLVGMGELSK